MDDCHLSVRLSKLGLDASLAGIVLNYLEYADKR